MGLKIYIDIFLQKLRFLFETSLFTRYGRELLWSGPALHLPESALPSAMLFAAEDEGRTEDPTERRRQKEREKGRVAKSAEIPGALVSLGGFITLFFLAGWVLSGLSKIMKFYLGSFTQIPDLEKPVLIDLLVSVITETGYLLAPVFMVVIIMAIAGNVVQVGLMFSLKPLAFDFSRIKLTFSNMAKRVFFSKQVFVNLVKTLAKLVVLGWVSYFIIATDFVDVMKTSSISVGDALRVLSFIGFKLVLILTVILLLIAIPDYFYQRFEFTESVKMTKEEVKEEFKETEGDPLIKQRQKQRQMEMSRRSMMSQVPDADVVVTNPTHFAVALRYDPAKEQSPRVLAKGADHMAFMIRTLAKKQDIPVVESKYLARSLYDSVNEGEEVPEQFYTLLIEIFTSVQSLAEKLKARSAGAA